MSEDVHIDENITLLRDTLRRLRSLEPESPGGPYIDQMAVLVEKLDLEIAALKDEVLAAKQGQSKFVSVVTHELRVPLTSIKGYTDLLMQQIVGPVNEQQANFLNVIRTNVNRMSALISDLADMTHIQTGRLKFHFQKTDLTQLVNDLLTLWRPRFNEKEQQLLIEIDPLLPQIQVDPIRMKQVLGYLMNNANRYTPACGQVSLILEKSHQRLHIEVRDNGLGISPEDQSKLFTPFFRSEETSVRETPGWGLSLHVAYLLVGLMGGTMGATSQPGTGSTFWLEIPIVD